MSKKKSRRKEYVPTAVEQARDELFSHILRCGVLEAAEEQRKEWFDDTMEYLAERYEDLTPVEVTDLRALGERYCQPVVARKENVEAGVA
jgi:hypothetical protein